MEKIPRNRSHWKIDESENYQFKLKYCFYFNEIFPEFGNEIKNKIFPLYLKLFGSYRELDLLLSELSLFDSSALQKKDYKELLLSAKYRSKKLDSETSIESDCIKFVDRSHEILNKYKLISDDYDFWANRWIIHSFYCSVASGTPRLA